jgi:hypothetical protein
MKKTVAGLLALSLVSSAGLVSAKSVDHSEHSNGQSSEKSHVERQVKDVVRDQVRTVVQDHVQSLKDQIQEKVKTQISNLAQEDIVQAAKDQAKVELKKYKHEEIKQILQEKVNNLAQNYAFNHPEQFAELGQFYKSLGDDSIKTFVNGKALVTDVPPFVQSGRTLVPVRAIVASLKANVQWDPTTQTVTIQRGDNTIELQIGSNEYLLNGEKGTIDVPAILKNGRTFLPLRAISQLLGAKVDYESEGNIAVVEDGASATGTDSSTQTAVSGTDTTSQTGTTSTDTTTQTAVSGTDATSQTGTTSTDTTTQAGVTSTDTTSQTSTTTSTSTSTQSTEIVPTTTSTTN